MSTRAANHVYSLQLALPPRSDDPCGHRRLRMALKALGRRFGIRCASVQAAAPPPPEAKPTAADLEALAEFEGERRRVIESKPPSVPF